MALRIVLCVAIAGTLLGFSSKAVGQQSSVALDAVKKFNLSTQPGDVPVYYSTCCKERALAVQATLEDCLRFYREKLGIHMGASAAVLDKNDWSRIDELLPADDRSPYGMTHVTVRPYLAFVPADDNGVITQTLLHDRLHETVQTRDLLQSVHLSFDQAAVRFIVHPMLHELGHTFTIEYGIHPPEEESSEWLFELLASYFAYAYEKAKRPETATIVEAVATMSSGPLKYTALEDFPKSGTLMENGDSTNFLWYQHQFEGWLVEVYGRQGLDFLTKMKAAFPAGTKDDLSSAQTLARIEEVSPGFKAWAAKMANMQTIQKNGPTK